MKRKQVINILFHKSYRNKKSFYQYFWIKNINNVNNKAKKSYVCSICYHRFSTSTALNRHLLICNAFTKDVYPPEKTFLSFDDKKAAKFANPLAIIGFSDFEAKLENIPNIKNKDTNNFRNSFTVKKDIHSIVSFSLIFVDTYGELIFEKCYCGDNAVEYFFNTLDRIEEKIYLIFVEIKKLLVLKHYLLTS